MRKIHSWLLLIAGLISFPSCGQKTFDEKMESLYRNTIPLIKSAELKSLKDSSQVFVLDTRETKEFQVSHIPGSRFVGYDDFDQKTIADIPKDARIVVYCSVGYRSERIGEKLKKIGYQDVQNLYGGIFNWKNQGNTVINLKQMPTDSVHTYNKNWSQWLNNGIKVYE
ncbi:MAG: rhodanese-like domain-containing protein [Marinoscillum sp.]